MEIIVDERYQNLGIQTIVFAVLKDVDVTKPMTPEMVVIQNNAVQSIMDVDLKVYSSGILEGYRTCVQSVGRSLQKFPPTALALMRNVQRRRALPDVNTVVNIYNTFALTSHYSIGAHDLDRIQGPLEFGFAQEGAVFYPIGGGTKRVLEVDYVLQDTQNILALLDARDAEIYKIQPETTQFLLIIQGHADTDVVSRKKCLETISKMIVASCGGHYHLYQVQAGSSICIDL